MKYASKSTLSLNNLKILRPKVTKNLTKFAKEVLWIPTQIQSEKLFRPWASIGKDIDPHAWAKCTASNLPLPIYSRLTHIFALIAKQYFLRFKHTRKKSQIQLKNFDLHLNLFVFFCVSRWLQNKYVFVLVIDIVRFFNEEICAKEKFIWKFVYVLIN